MGQDSHPYSELWRLFLKPSSLRWAGMLALIAVARQYSLWSNYDAAGQSLGVSPLALVFEVASWVFPFVALARLARRFAAGDQAPAAGKWWSYLGLVFASIAVSLFSAFSWGLASSLAVASLPPAALAVLATAPVVAIEGALLFVSVKLVSLAVGGDVPFREILHFVFRRHPSLTIYSVILGLATTEGTLALSILLPRGGTNGSLLNYALALSVMTGVTEIVRTLFPIVVFRRWEREQTGSAGVFS